MAWQTKYTNKRQYHWLTKYTGSAMVIVQNQSHNYPYVSSNKIMLSKTSLIFFVATYVGMVVRLI